MKITSFGRSLIVLGAAAALMTGCQGASAGTLSSVAAASAPGSASPSTPEDNGVAALEPSVIVARAKAALRDAKSFRYKGWVKTEGQRVNLDFKISRKDIGGTVAVGKTKIQLLKVAGKSYMKPNATYWKMSVGKRAGAVIEVLGDRWVKIPASNKGFSAFFQGADVDRLLGTRSKVTKGRTKVIAGTPAIGVVDHGTHGGRLYVATVGEPYPLRIDIRNGADGNIAFSEFGATFPDIAKPAKADVLDMAKIFG